MSRAITRALDPGGYLRREANIDARFDFIPSVYNVPDLYTDKTTVIFGLNAQQGGWTLTIIE